MNTFYITRSGRLFHDAEFVGKFANQDVAAAMAAEFSRDQGKGYTLNYDVADRAIDAGEFFVD